MYLAKLFYGGAVSLYSGAVTFSGECGIEKEQERGTETGMVVFVIDDLVQEL